VCNYSPDRDWDIRQYDLASGLPWPDCFGSPGALSAGVGTADFVIGDFHFNSPGAQYVRSYQFTAGITFFLKYGYTEWDAGEGDLVVNGTPISVPLTSSDPSTDRLWCYQVYLHSGLPYTFEFSRSGTASTNLLLFRNPGGIYWAPRSAAVFSVTSDQPYTPPADGWYGVVVVKDDDGTGGFTLGVSSTVAGVADDALPVRDALRAVIPNPAHGAMRVEFDLASAATPQFDLIDTQGRLVSRVQPGSHGAGRWSVALDAYDRQGRSVAPGVYLVRMRLGERTVATKKIILEP